MARILFFLAVICLPANAQDDDDTIEAATEPLPDTIEQRGGPVNELERLKEFIQQVKDHESTCTMDTGDHAEEAPAEDGEEDGAEDPMEANAEEAPADDAEAEEVEEVEVLPAEPADSEALLGEEVTDASTPTEG